MRKPQLFGLALLATVLVPGAAADQATTSTGDVDVYNVDPGQFCSDVLLTWRVTLTLVAPSPGDHVAVAAQGRDAEAAVATFEEPQVDVIVDGGGCAPATQVVGLVVDGDAPYEISWQPV